MIGYGQGIATYFACEKVTAKKKIAWLNTDLEKAHYDIDFVQKFYMKVDNILWILRMVKTVCVDFSGNV